MLDAQGGPDSTGPWAVCSSRVGWPGERPQAIAADYDGDGDLGLLVGDYPSEDRQMHGWVWPFRRR
jgi:hypothetical protein